MANGRPQIRSAGHDAAMYMFLSIPRYTLLHCKQEIERKKERNPLHKGEAEDIIGPGGV